jgi:hypothetical protein
MAGKFETELQRRGYSASPSRFQSELIRREESEEDRPAGVADTVAQFPMGFNSRLANYVEPIERTVRMVADLAHLKEPSWKGAGAPLSDWLRDSPAPVNVVQRGLRRAGEVTGETAPYAALSLGGAPAVAAATRSVVPSSLTKASLNTLATGITNAPGGAAAGELIASTGAGLASQTARELFPGNQTADDLALLAGGVAPAALAYTPLNLATRLGRRAWETLSPSSQRLSARNQVAKTLGGELSPEALAGIDEGQALRRDIPGFEPSLAESTGSPSLIATQRQIEAGASGPRLDELTRRRVGNQTAIQAYARQSAPNALSDPELVIDTATRRVENLRSRIGREREDLGQFSAATANNIPAVNRPEVGAGLRASMTDRQNEARLRMAQLSDQLGISDVDISLPFSRFQDELRGGITRTAFEDRANVPGVVNEILNYGRRTPDSTRTLLKELRRGSTARPKSLMEFLRSKGGIKDDAGELRARDFGGRGGLLNNRTGRRLDDLAQVATEAGYFPGKDRASPEDLLAALDQEARGRPIYSEFDYASAQRADDLDIFREELDRAGINLNLPDDEIVRRMEFDTGTRSGPSVTFKDLMGLRSRISDDLRDSMSAANPSAKKIRALTELERRVDDFIGEATNTADEGLASRYREFRQAYKTGYIDRFKQGAAFKVKARDGRGYYKIPDERVADAFFSDVNGIRQFRRTFGEDAPEFEALESVALDDLRQAAVRNGELSPTLFNTWLRQNQAKLAELPALRERVGNLQAATEAVRTRNAELTRRERVIGQQLLTKQLASFERGKEPQAVIAAALKSPRLMGQLVGSVRRQPEALEALRRSVWDEAPMGSATELESFLKTNRSALREVLTPDHINSLTKIATALRQVERVPAPAGRAIDSNPLAGIEGTLGTGVNQLASRVFAVESGRTSWRYIATDLIGRYTRAHSRAEAERLMNEALYNPEIAKDLAQVFVAKRAPGPVANRLNTWLFELGQEPEDR